MLINILNLINDINEILNLNETFKWLNTSFNKKEKGKQALEPLSEPLKAVPGLCDNEPCAQTKTTTSIQLERCTSKQIHSAVGR